MTSEIVLTFSGTHSFRRQHAGQRGSRAQELVNEERCPRCEGPLYPPNREEHAYIPRRGDRTPVWRPAGSRVTACRCIPVCDLCGNTEAMGDVARDLAIQGFDTSEDGTVTAQQVSEALEYVWKTANTPTVNWPLNRELLVFGWAVIQSTLGEVQNVPVDQIHPREHSGGWGDPDNFSDDMPVDGETQSG